MCIWYLKAPLALRATRAPPAIRVIGNSKDAPACTALPFHAALLKKCSVRHSNSQLLELRYISQFTVL